MGAIGPVERGRRGGVDDRALGGKLFSAVTSAGGTTVVDDAAQRMEQSREKRGYPMLTRDELHRLIDAIPDSKLAVAATALEPLVDPVMRALLTAPIDDEPESEEERAAVAEAKAELARGEFLTHEEVKRRHGL